MFTSIDEVLRRPIEFTLTSAVGVMNERAARVAPRQRHVQRGERQLGAQVIGIAQPITRREKQSMIVDKYNQPSQVRT